MSKDDSSEIFKDMESMIDAKAEDYNKIIEFANKKNVIMLAFIGSYAPKRHNPSFSASASMNIKDEFGVEKILNEIKDKKQDYKNQKVYFLINSMGGSLSSAYKIARAIRLSFNDITVFIPHYALSGGTLLSLIGDDIRMGMMSQLGPLDIQLPYNNQRISVNSLFRAKNRLDKSFTTSKPEELPYTFKRMVDYINPIIFEEWVGIRQEGIIYLKEILKLSKYQEQQIPKLIDYLTFKFPTHGFVINYSIAKAIGLNVGYYTKDIEAWNIMRTWLAHYIIKQTDKHFIRYVLPSNNNGQG